MTYTLYYKYSNDLFWKKIKNVKWHMRLSHENPNSPLFGQSKNVVAVQCEERVLDLAEAGLMLMLKKESLDKLNKHQAELNKKEEERVKAELAKAPLIIKE